MHDVLYSFFRSKVLLCRLATSRVKVEKREEKRREEKRREENIVFYANQHDRNKVEMTEN